MLYIGSDTVFQVTLTDPLTGDPIDTATVNGVLATLDGSTIASESGSYQAGTSGQYTVIFPASVTGNLSSCTEYLVTITATWSGATREFQDQHLAVIGV